MEVEWVRNGSLTDDWEMLFWARGGDFEQFETGLEADPTVSPVRTVELGTQRLYQVKISDEGAKTDLYPNLVEIGGLVLSATVSRDGWYCRFGFPDQAGVGRYFDAVEQYDVNFDIHRIYELQNAEPELSYDLTDPQREALLTAFEAGYFEIPRKISIAELGDKLGTSDQAASERLRRGLRKLVDNAVPIVQNSSTTTEPLDRRVD
jgi:predicted DNA binding protein